MDKSGLKAIMRAFHDNRKTLAKLKRARRGQYSSDSAEYRDVARHQEVLAAAVMEHTGIGTDELNAVLYYAPHVEDQYG